MESSDQNYENNEAVRGNGEAHADGQVEGVLQELRDEPLQNDGILPHEDHLETLDDPCQSAVLEYLMNGVPTDELGEAIQEFEDILMDQHDMLKNTGRVGVRQTNHTGAATVAVEQPEAVVRKRRAANDEDESPSVCETEHEVSPRPRVLRRVDDGFVEVEQGDMPFGGNYGNATQGLLVLRAVRLCLGRHKLQNEAELTFIKLIVLEILNRSGLGCSNRLPVLLKKRKDGDQDNTGNPTYRWEYTSKKNSLKTVFLAEASFEDVQKYFEGKPATKSSFEGVWSKFLRNYGSTLPGTFISTMNDIEEASTIDDFANVYDSEYFQTRLEQLEAAQSGREGSIEEWCKQWALRLAQNNLHNIESLNAYNLNMTRKCALKLLYSMYDKCFPKEGQPSVSIDDIAQHFGIARIIRILQTCLPMDRANALYNMKHTVRRKGGTPTNIQGMIWFAKKRDGRIVEQWRADGNPRRNDATINKRLVWYFSVPEFGLEQYPQLVEWMKPCTPE